jgi:hypothetical protein
MNYWERPFCRRVIEEHRYFPIVLIPKDGLVWDGHTIGRPDGNQAEVFGSMRKQMIKMCLEGKWPEIKDVVIRKL